MCADVIRPGIGWLLTTATPKRLAAEMARTRDPAGFAELAARCDANPVGETTTRVALHRVAAILAAKGGMVADITIGDCLELLGIAADVCDVPHYKSPYFYQLLHAAGVLGDAAAPTVRALTTYAPAQPGTADRPVRHPAPAGTRPSHRLPAGTPGQHRPCHAGAAGRCPRPPVLAGPGASSSRPGLAPPFPRRRGGVEAAGLHQDDQPQAGRRPPDRGLRPAAERHELPVSGPVLLPRHRPVGC